VTLFTALPTKFQYLTPTFGTMHSEPLYEGCLISKVHQVIGIKSEVITTLHAAHVFG